MPNKQSEIFIRRAFNDLNSARILNTAFVYPKPIEIICFHAQQAAEKIIKAAIINALPFIEVEPTHKLMVLLNKLKENSIYYPDVFNKYAKEFAPYSVDNRYDDAADVSLTSDDADMAIIHSQEIYDYMLEIARKEMKSLYLSLFPDFDEDLVIPKGWIDSSEIEDGMPSISLIENDSTIKVTINYKNKDMRSEHTKLDKRYTLYYNGDKILEHNSIDKIINAIKNRSYQINEGKTQ